MNMSALHFTGQISWGVFLVERASPWQPGKQRWKKDMAAIFLNPTSTSSWQSDTFVPAFIFKVNTNSETHSVCLKHTHSFLLFNEHMWGCTDELLCSETPNNVAERESKYKLFSGKTRQGRDYLTNCHETGLTCLVAIFGLMTWENLTLSLGLQALCSETTAHSQQWQSHKYTQTHSNPPANQIVFETKMEHSQLFSLITHTHTDKTLISAEQPEWSDIHWNLP